MSNEERLGEFSVFYVNFETEIDTKQADAFVLGDDSWEEFFITDLTRNTSSKVYPVKDRFVKANTVYAYGKRELALGFNINQLRITPSQRKKIDQAIAGRKTVSVLALVDDRIDPGTHGIVGNFVIESQSEEHPEEGLNKESYSLKPSNSQFKSRAIYGVLAPFNTPLPIYAYFGDEE